MKTLNLLVLRCRDMERSRMFYSCFGMAFERHSHGGGPVHYASEDESGVWELYPLANDAAVDNTGLGFGETDLSAVYGRFVDAGFSPQPIGEKPWGRTFIVRDPDGRRVEVKETPRCAAGN